jgi:hypothetical protein
VWRGLARASHVVWSRDSRHVSVESTPPSEHDSPDGRWTVQYLSGSYAVVPRGGTRPVATVAGRWWTWSPDSRFLAYTAAAGITVLDMHTRQMRRLTRDIGSQLTWSPDGALLAYVDCCTDGDSVGIADIRTVTRSGTVRVIVPAARAGVVTTVVWAHSDNSAAYRPAPDDLPGVYTTAPVEQLAADGAGIGFAACGVVSLWTPADGSVVRGPTVTACLPYYSPGHVYTLALAGHEVAYGVICCNNVKSWTLSVDVFGQSPQQLLAGGGDACCTSYPVLAGHGSLVAYADRSGFPDYLWTVRTPGGQPLMTFEQNRFVQVALDVDGDRILVARDGAVDVVLSENGGTVFQLDVPVATTYPFVPPDAQLDGPFVAVRDGDTVDVYAVNGGALLHTWPLPDGSRLEDAARGLLAVRADGEIFVLRLTDGLRARVGPGTLAAFMDDGLAIANGARVRLVPYGLLPAN